MVETRQPGKFEGCNDQDLATRLNEISLDGGCDQELGDVEDFGWYGLILNLNGKSYIISEDNQGFFDYSEYDTTEQAQAKWAELESEYDKFMEDNEEL